MTSPGGNRRSPGSGRAGRSGGRASSPGRRGRTWPGPVIWGVRYSHQVTDLPGARAETIQHDRHEVECACGRTHARFWPVGRKGDETIVAGRSFVPMDIWRALEQVPPKTVATRRPAACSVAFPSTSA